MNFINDLAALKEKLVDESYAQSLYAALCNNEWIKIAEAPENWSDALKTAEFGQEPSWFYAGTWRFAGGLVADLREQDECYMDFYCSGCWGTAEGEVTEEVAVDLKSLGWVHRPMR